MVAIVLAVLAALTPPAPTSRIAFAADRAPLHYGEIYRVAADGAVTNLSRSPAADTFPAASPDGKHVAFVSVRGGRVRIYVVGSDGRNLHPVSPPLATVGPHDGAVALIAWAPDNRRIAVELNIGAGTPALHLTSVAGGWRTVAHGLAQQPVSWSPDGTRLAFATQTGLVDVIDSRTGRTLWNAGGRGTPAWSAHGLLAVAQNSTMIAVYEENGRLRASFHGNAFAWSPSGDVLASDRLGSLELRTNGAGTPTLRAKLVPGARADDGAHIEWLGPTRIRLYDNRFVGYDVARRHTFALPAGADTYGSVISANGVAAHVQAGELVRGVRIVRTAPTCGDDLPFESVQFLGRTNALVYQSGCILPSADIYTVDPDGTGLQQVTKTPQHEFSPALSPDGSRVAYAQQQVADRCDGCPQSLWIGSTQLTNPQYSDDAPFDVDPSWSPDGKQLVYSQSGPDSPFELMTIPAAGGTPQRLVAGLHPAWGPKLIAFEVDGTPPKIETYDPATHAVATVAVTKGLDPSTLAWSNDGRLAYLAYSAHGHAWISIVGGGSFDLNTLLPPKSQASGLAWSPDDTRFAFIATDRNGNGEVYTVGTNGRGLQQVTKDLDAVGNLSWR